jgi:hypothetical protein
MGPQGFTQPGWMGTPDAYPLFLTQKSAMFMVTGGFLAAFERDIRRLAQGAQNDLEMDFVMYWTSPEGMSVFTKNRLDPNNLQSAGIAGPPIVKGVELPADVTAKLQRLKFIGNYEKPGNPGDAVARGFFKHQPSLRDWVDLFQSYLRGDMDAKAYGTRYQALLEKHWPDLLKFLNVTDADLNTPEKRPPNWVASGPY